MKNNFKGGVWPVMLTPFTLDGEVDYDGLEKLVNWYIEQGVSGLFAVCQSSEMVYLTLEERTQIAKHVVKVAKNRVPVIASGHISNALSQQAIELNAMAKTGVDAVILITNKLALEAQGDDVWLKNLDKLLGMLDFDLPLGFYECPFPYKRLLTPEQLRWCVDSGKFQFIKDTCCDLDILKQRIDIIKGSELKLYNANTTTLLDSLKYGADGYSGVMANFHADKYVWLCNNLESDKAQAVADVLSIASLIEKQYYPVNAKYHLAINEKLGFSTYTRVKDHNGLTETFIAEVNSLDNIIKRIEF